MRNIDWTRPLSEDDKAWALQRDLHDKVAANEAEFAEDEPQVEVVDDPQQVVDPPAAEDVAPDDDYDQWKVAELRAEAHQREIADNGTMKRPELIAALRKYDAEHPED